MAFMRDPYYILMQDGLVNITPLASDPHDQGGEPTYCFGQDEFDEIVMMRFYNMTEEERRAAIGRILETQFETGADGVRKASGLPTVIERSFREAMRL